MKNVLRILELAWLAIAIVSAFIAIYQSYTIGIANSWYFFIFTSVAALMYTVRRKQRIKNDQQKP